VEQLVIAAAADRFGRCVEREREREIIQEMVVVVVGVS
jgi:hypothetical protein